MNNFVKYFKKSDNINSSFIKNSSRNNSNPNVIIEFMNKNIFWFVLVVLIGIVVFYIIYLVKDRKNNKKGPQKIKYNYSRYKVDDNLKHEPVGNEKLECPKLINQYSFAFFLELQDFYCDTGYWKGIMVKGHELNGNNSICGKIRTNQYYQLQIVLM